MLENSQSAYYCIWYAEKEIWDLEFICYVESRTPFFVVVVDVDLKKNHVAQKAESEASFSLKNIFPWPWKVTPISIIFQITKKI